MIIVRNCNVKLQLKQSSLYQTLRNTQADAAAKTFSFNSWIAGMDQSNKPNKKLIKKVK